jgi:hypothetical protein
MEDRMTFVVFATEAEALAAERAIVANVRRLVAVVAPNRIAADGAILGVNLCTGEVSAARTERWALPVRLADGRYAIAEPDAEFAGTLPMAEIMAGVAAGQRITDEEMVRMMSSVRP